MVGRQEGNEGLRNRLWRKSGEVTGLEIFRALVQKQNESQELEGSVQVWGLKSRCQRWGKV